MPPPPKSIAMLALGKASPPMDEEEGPGEGLEMAMQDFMDALDARDAAGAAVAFRNAVDLVGSD